MDRSELEALAKPDLIDLAERQAGRIAELEARLAGIDHRVEELERKAVRGAAPFAREGTGRRKAAKRPGRKGGHKGSFRVRPDDDAGDRDIDVPVDQCPGCAAAREVNAGRLPGAPRDGPEDRIRLRIAKQGDPLFTLLDHPAVDATSNLAGRQTRPAVISRKALLRKQDRSRSPDVGGACLACANLSADQDLARRQPRPTDGNRPRKPRPQAKHGLPMAGLLRRRSVERPRHRGDLRRFLRGAAGGQPAHRALRGSTAPPPDLAARSGGPIWARAR